jgi:hypothetical protein
MAQLLTILAAMLPEWQFDLLLMECWQWALIWFSATGRNKKD